MSLHNRLNTWAALRAPVVRPRTREYHQELIDYITRTWPERIEAVVDGISEPDLAAFAVRIAPLSDSRFNGIVTMLRATVPAAKKMRRRRLRIKERPLLDQLQFSRLLDELDGRPRSQAGLVIRFLSHTGLRINEARQLTWTHVREDFLFVPGEISKSGKPRVIPFVKGLKKIVRALRTATAGRDQVIPQGECKRALETACELAGLPRLSHHSFRHHYGTRCIQSGVDLPTLARWFDHHDGGTLLGKTYYHLVDEHSRRMAARVRI